MTAGTTPGQWHSHNDLDDDLDELEDDDDLDELEDDDELDDEEDEDGGGVVEAGPIEWTGPADGDRGDRGGRGGGWARESGPRSGPAPVVVEVLEPGDVVAMLLDRVEAADLLDEQDVADLAQLLGDRAARRLAGVLNRELRQAQRARPRRTLVQGLFGGLAPAPVPAAGSVSAVLLGIESGQRLDRHERARLAGAAGRGGAQVLEREIRRACGPRGRWDQ